MKKIRLNENDIERLVNRIIKEDKQPLKEFDIDSYEETSSGINEISDYIDTLGLTEEQANHLFSLIDSYGDDMWREGAQGGFAPK